MHDLLNCKYFFKYLSTGNDVDINWLEQLFNQEEIRYFWQEHPSLRGWITFKQIIQYKKLYFCRYDKLNDPFECIANIDYTLGIDDETIKAYYKKIQGAVSSDMLTKLGLDNLDAFKRNVTQYALEKRSPPYSPVVPMPFGIYSINTNPENIQMWSHYANSHQGICII